MPSIPDLLDTNVIVHLVRDDAVGRRLKAERRLLVSEPAPAICSVTEGEIRSLAHQFDWGRDKRDKMAFLLGFFPRVSIENRATMEAYAVMDAYSGSIGISMGKNDVWIAAAAYITGYPVVTTDRDFDHLDGGFLQRILIEEALT